MDPFSPSGGTASHRVITGSAVHDDIVLEDANPGVDDGKLLVTFQGLTFFDGVNSTQSYVIDSPIASGVPGDTPPSLTITTGAGGDKITVKSLDRPSRPTCSSTATMPARRRPSPTPATT